ncbi:MAG TPA: hypothetical protein VGB55_15380 [Tepidisphaeraceae bacterium]
MQQYIESPAHRTRFDNVDVLSLLDANWLETSQASRLLQMVDQAKRDGSFEERAESEAA